MLGDIAGLPRANPRAQLRIAVGEIRLAQTLWRYAPAARARVRALAVRSLEWFREAGADHEAERKEIERWLASRPRRAARAVEPVRDARAASSAAAPSMPFELHRHRTELTSGLTDDASSLRSTVGAGGVTVPSRQVPGRAIRRRTRLEHRAQLPSSDGPPRGQARPDRRRFAQARAMQTQRA
jgi:hypothetical protein